MVSGPVNKINGATKITDAELCLTVVVAMLYILVDLTNLLCSGFFGLLFVVKFACSKFIAKILAGTTILMITSVSKGFRDRDVYEESVL